MPTPPPPPVPTIHDQQCGANCLINIRAITRIAPTFSHFVQSTNRSAYVERREPACAKVSEEKRRTVWAEGEFSTFSERAHSAGRLGTSALIFFCFVFLYQDKKMKWVWAKPNRNPISNAYTEFVRSTKQIGLRAETGTRLCEMSVKNVELFEP